MLIADCKSSFLEVKYVHLKARLYISLSLTCDIPQWDDEKSNLGLSLVLVANVYQILSIIATLHECGHPEEWVAKTPFRRKRAHHQPAAGGLTLGKVEANEEHFAIPDRQSPDAC